MLMASVMRSPLGARRLPPAVSYVSSVLRRSALHRSFSAAALRQGDMLSKLQTIPFQRKPTSAMDMLENAAAKLLNEPFFAAFYRRTINKLFGTNLQQTKVRQIGFKALLVPCWKLDVAATVRAVMKDDISVDLHVSLSNATFPGFTLDPLDRMNLSADLADEELVTYNPAIHAHQLDGSIDITVLPFRRSPLSLLSTIGNLKKTNMEQHGVEIDFRRVKPVLFAVYPLMVPLYLGEYVEIGGSERRVTAVCVATSDQPNVSMFPTAPGSNQWLTGYDKSAIKVIAATKNEEGRLSGPAQDVASLQSQLNTLASKVTPIGLTHAIHSFDAIISDPRVMPFSENAIANDEYIKAHFELVTAQDALRQITCVPEDAARFIVMSQSGFKYVSSKRAIMDSKRRVRKVERALQILKPMWMEEQEKRDSNPASIIVPPKIVATTLDSSTLLKPTPAAVPVAPTPKLKTEIEAKIVKVGAEMTKKSGGKKKGKK